jgi:hypothetical protein
MLTPALRPIVLPPTLVRARDLPAPVLLGIAAVCVYLTVSSNLLFRLGIPYAQTGGSYVVKLHPGTWLLLAAVALHLLRARLPLRTAWDCTTQRPALAAYLALLVLCIVFGALVTQSDILIVFIESFMPAALLSIVLTDASPCARRLLGRAMLAAFAANVALVLAEAVLQRHLIPVWLGDDPFVDPPGEFRGAALYDHPLTGSAMTLIGVFLVLGTPRAAWLRAPLLLWLLVGLLAFGGRTALAVTLAALTCWGAARLLHRLLARRLRLAELAAALAACTIGPLLFAILLAATSIGERIAARFYWDDSARARGVQWRMLDQLDAGDWLFGMRHARFEQLVAQLGLTWHFSDVENFWLWMFLDLGLLGFAIFLPALVIFLAAEWRRATPAGRIMLLALLVVASTSNSLARKSSLLTVAIAAAAAMPRTAATARVVPRPVLPPALRVAA